jgi:hypothetical protein
MAPVSRHDGRAPPEVAAAGEPGQAGPGLGRAGEAGVSGDAGTSRGGARGQLSSPGLQGVVALAVYLAVWVIAEVFPLVLHPARPQLDQASMDPNFYTWSLRWWPYAIGHGLNPLHTAEVGAPADYGLAWVTTVPPLALLVAPLTVLAGPVVSFNLLVAASIPVSGWAAFVVCRRLTRRFWAALAGGAVYGFSAYELNHIFAGQLNLAVSLLLPLMAYLVVVWRDGAIGTRAFTGLLALAMALQFYLFLETFADMTAVWVLALAAGYALAGPAGRPVVARLARLAGAAYALALVFAAPYLAYALTHVPRGYVSSPASSSLDLAGLVIPRPGQTFGVHWLASSAAPLPIPGRDGYVGIPLLALVVALAIMMWSRRIARFLVVTLALLVLVALGPVLHVDGHQLTSLPWAHLWLLPVVRSAYPARFMVFAFLALAVLVAIWLAGPAPRPWARWALALVAIAAVAANVPSLTIQNRPGLPAFITTGEYRHYLAPGDTVVVVSQVGNAGMLWQAETGFYTQLAGGYLNEHLARRTDLPRPLATLTKGPLTQRNTQQFRLFLSKARVAAILVQPSRNRTWPRILRQLGFHGHATGGVILYRTAP